MSQSIQINAIAITIILISVFVVSLFLRKIARVYKDSEHFTIPDSIPSTGIEIPVIGTFGGFKGSVYLSISENTFNPKFILHDDYLEYRVLVSKNADYSQIESVQEISFLFNNYLKVNFHDRFLSVSARLANKEIMHEITGFFQSRGIPVKGRTHQASIG